MHQRRGPLACVAAAPEPSPLQCWSPTRRHTYVTPTSYLELLGTLVRLLGEKRAELAAARRRLEIGLSKLTASAAQVGGWGVRAQGRAALRLQARLPGRLAGDSC